MTDGESRTDTGWDIECDVLVAGSGAGALVGAHVAASAGASTILVESTDLFGGVTAYSGAGLWLPGNHVLLEAGVPDSVEHGRQYLRAVVGEHRVDLQEAFLAGGPEVIEYLSADPHVTFEHRPFPDYFSVPGALDLGRDIFPSDIDGAELGDLLDRLRPTAVQERLGIPDKRAVLGGGQALLGRLLLAARGVGVDLRVGHRLEGLITDGGAVIGAEVVAGDRTLRIRARTGVLLAAGGFEANDELRQQWQGMSAEWTMGPSGGQGKALLAGIAAGAATDLLEECWWSPGVEFPDGSAVFTLGFRGGIIVNGAGRRYANESLPYDRFGREMRKGEAAGEAAHIPSWLIFDSRFKGDVPAIVTVPPLDHQAFFDAGKWHSADTLAELAEAIGVPADALEQTVAEFNGYAAAGVDAAFGRGEAPYDRFFADPRAGGTPNPVLVPVETGPFTAVRMVLADLGTKGGLVTDDHARVLSEADHTPIPGLYAAGNTMAAMSGHSYPGPGVPIGSCMVFAYLAAQDMLAARHGVGAGA